MERFGRRVTRSWIDRWRSRFPAEDTSTQTTWKSSSERLVPLRRADAIEIVLGQGAKLPKPLMLFVKNMVFLDGAIATLAPEVDLVASDVDRLVEIGVESLAAALATLLTRLSRQALHRIPAGC